ncbi:aminoacyl-tRNA hydrolase, partial [Oenococcus oeni]|uniref:aminoacyl-tRNA hydrolase n=1 Tax=Oenococcus oeni TaxID=1247 RepID=UPI0008F905E0
TMMNDSGIAVKAVLNYFGGDVNDLIVFVDDIDRDYGQLRIKKSGASGGHNGLKSIVSQIASQEFLRIRIGTGRPAHNPQAVIKHVLGDFSPLQLELVHNHDQYHQQRQSNHLHPHQNNSKQLLPQYRNHSS